MIGLEMCPRDSKKTDWKRGRFVFAHSKLCSGLGSYGTQQRAGPGVVWWDLGTA